MSLGHELSINRGGFKNAARSIFLAERSPPVLMKGAEISGTEVLLDTRCAVMYFTVRFLNRKAMEPSARQLLLWDRASVYVLVWKYCVV
jgi:hypothetical protein